MSKASRPLRAARISTHPRSVNKAGAASIGEALYRLTLDGEPRLRGIEYLAIAASEYALAKIEQTGSDQSWQGALAIAEALLAQVQAMQTEHAKALHAAFAVRRAGGAA